LEPSVLDRIAPDQVVSIEREVFPALAAEGHLFGIPTDGYWMDIGTPEKYLQANLDWLAGRVSLDPTRERGSARSPSALVDENAQVSSACIGARCVVEDAALVQESVLLDDVFVGSGARVTSSVLGEGVRVAPGSVVDGRAVGDGEVIEAEEGEAG
jgi:NDP-sugar pyrophosphorylase family protein